LWLAGVTTMAVASIAGSALAMTQKIRRGGR
jgi:hypothetical protein